MVELTKSLRHFLFEKYRDIYVLLMFGHLELFTEEIEAEYLEWCATDEGKKYLLNTTVETAEAWNRRVNMGEINNNE